MEFHPQDALDAAMRAFWARGYGGTSLQDLESCTGLARSSLYNSFGSKRAIYLKSVDRYKQLLGEVMFVPLESGIAGLEDIEAFFGRLEKGLNNLLGAPSAAKGCMLINGMVESGGKDPSLVALNAAFVGRFRSSMMAALHRARRRGEITSGDTEEKVTVLLSMALAINVAWRWGTNPAGIRQFAEAARRQVGAWRLTRGAKAASR
jgi:TetR/AcrR family transcriptional repressor of nem operon